MTFASFEPVNSMMAPIEGDEKPLQRVMTFKYFELTEISHDALRPNTGTGASSRDPLSVHDRCMKWYETVSEWMPQLLGNDPFAEFLQ